MQIAIIKDNQVESMGEHRELFKNVAFPKSGPPADWMIENSVMPVTMSRSYDRMTQKSTSVDPYIESGVVYLTQDRRPNRQREGRSADSRNEQNSRTAKTRT